MKKSQLLLIEFFMTALCGCKAKPLTMVGNDKDAHGGISSTGYQWCSK
jgi:hypothetical protein